MHVRLCLGFSIIKTFHHGSRNNGCQVMKCLGFYIGFLIYRFRIRSAVFRKVPYSGVTQYTPLYLTPIQCPPFSKSWGEYSFDTCLGFCINRDVFKLH